MAMIKSMNQKITNTIATVIDKGSHLSVADAAEIVVKKLGLTEEWAQYTHVEVINQLYINRFKKIPYKERILFLPHCLRNSKECKATYDENGLQCKECGKCSIGEIKKYAENLGYGGVYVTPGGSMVKKVVKEKNPKAVVGVACFNEIMLVKDSVVTSKMPGQAVKLLKDGCVDTKVDIDAVKEKLKMFEGE
ncbi:MAG: DUF116 domain-containing protein [Candidatus Diapherotrites archaeon]|nr:DUF116 domain-containing protein [Candidatus Diapherotrites archaeon]